MKGSLLVERLAFKRRVTRKKKKKRQPRGYHPPSLRAERRGGKGFFLGFFPPLTVVARANGECVGREDGNYRRDIFVIRLARSLPRLTEEQALPGLRVMHHERPLRDSQRRRSVLFSLSPAAKCRVLEIIVNWFCRGEIEWRGPWRRVLGKLRRAHKRARGSTCTHTRCTDAAPRGAIFPPDAAAAPSPRPLGLSFAYADISISPWTGSVYRRSDPRRLRQ